MRHSKLTRFRALLGAHLKRHLGGLAAGAAAAAGYAAADLLAPWPLKMILDHVLLATPLPGFLRQWDPIVRSQPELAIVVMSSAILAVAVLKGAFSYLQVFVTSRIGYQMVHKLRQELFSHLQRLSLSYHQRSRSGELLNKITADTNVLKDVFAGGILELLGHGLILGATLAVLLLLNRSLALVAALTLPLLGWTIFSIYRRSKTSARRQREREGEVAAHIGEVLALTPLVRAFARERSERERFDRQSSDTLQESIRTARVEAAAGRTVEVINSLGVWGAVLFGGLLALRGSITPGDLLVFTSYLTGMYKPLRNLAKLTTQFSKALVSAERIEQILGAETDGANDAGGADPGQLRGQVEFQDVWFGYDAGGPVLRGAGFRVEAGEHVALVGASGAGKSTVASLLLRFYRPRSGAIRVDGRDIREFDAEAYRSQIGVVLQDALLFGATVAENIAYGKVDATAAEIEEAARWAAAHEFIAALPDGYATVLNEHASMLSGGQRQRLCLARALLKRPPLMILDEPTAAIDSESTSHIHQAIANVRHGMTTVVIAHHFHDMERFDRILVLKEGFVVEQGSHAQLVRRRGAYWELLDRQRVNVEEQEVTS